MIIGNIMTKNDIILGKSHYAYLYKFSGLIENSTEVRVLILQARLNVHLGETIVYFV